MTLARYVPTPENGSALVAVRSVAARLCNGERYRAPNPLYVHGPTGTGKTHLIGALIDEVSRHSPQLVITVLQANELDGMANYWETVSEAADDLLAAKQSDLFVVEDIHRLVRRRPDDSGHCVAEMLVQLFDYLYARHRQLVFTATVGPRGLAQLPARLVSRLSCGLVVGLQPMQAASRLALLRDKAQRRQLAVSPEILAWLAEYIGSGRQLEGALVQLETLVRLHDRPIDLATVAAHFRQFVQANPLTVERITQQVGSYFQVEPKHVQSKRRHRSILLARQVGMYLSRELTNLSLEEIGSHFGGRDHSTVLHACRKIKDALLHDFAISGAVRQLQAELV